MAIGSPFQPQFPQAQPAFPQSQFMLPPQIQPMNTMPGASQPAGLPQAAAGLGMLPQDAFTAPAPQAPAPDAAGGFSDKNVTLSKEGWTNKVFSWTGLAVGAGTVAGGFLIHHFFFKETAQAAISTLSDAAKTETLKAFNALKEAHAQFIDHLKEEKTGEAEALVQPHLKTLEKNLSNKGSKEQKAICDKLNSAFQTHLDAKKIAPADVAQAKTDFETIHKDFTAKIEPELKVAETAEKAKQETEAAAAAEKAKQEAEAAAAAEKAKQEAEAAAAAEKAKQEAEATAAAEKAKQEAEAAAAAEKAKQEAEATNIPINYNAHFIVSENGTAFANPNKGNQPSVLSRFYNWLFSTAEKEAAKAPPQDVT